MDETNLNARSKRTRVLRATDVMPPFDKDVEPAGDGNAQGQHQEHGAAEPAACEAGADSGPAVAAGSTRDTPAGVESPAAVVEVPSYDLAANILAEQRRVASRRRRAPTQPDDPPVAAPAAAEARVSIVGFPPQNLMELQQVVAEIVARDIERLCRPNRPLSA